MHSVKLLLLISLISILVLNLFPLVSAEGNTQYATYRISLSGAGHPSSFVLNETLTPVTGNQANLTLHAISTDKNLSYSRIVNLTQMLFPILPSFSNQSLTYQSTGYSVSLSLTKSGTSTITFSGVKYTSTEFAFRVSAKSQSLIIQVTGNLSTFPSGLIYSTSAMINDTISMQASLLGTNLPLDPPGQGSSQTTTIAVASGIGAAGVIAAFALLRRAKGKVLKSTTPNANDEKPTYWVD